MLNQVEQEMKVKHDPVKNTNLVSNDEACLKVLGQQERKVERSTSKPARQESGTHHKPTGQKKSETRQVKENTDSESATTCIKTDDEIHDQMQIESENKSLKD